LAIGKRYKKGRPCCGQLLGEKTLKQPFNVGALNGTKERPMKCDKYIGMDVHQAMTWSWSWMRMAE
jgi:hypothetical protein